MTEDYKKQRLKEGFEEPGYEHIEHFSFVGKLIAELTNYKEVVNEIDYKVYEEVTSKIIVYITSRIPWRPRALKRIRYDKEIYQTKDNFFSAGPNYPNELVDKVKLFYGIDEAEEI